MPFREAGGCGRGSRRGDGSEPIETARCEGVCGDMVPTSARMLAVGVSPSLLACASCIALFDAFAVKPLVEGGAGHTVVPSPKGAGRYASLFKLWASRKSSPIAQCACCALPATVAGLCAAHAAAVAPFVESVSLASTLSFGRFTSWCAEVSVHADGARALAALKASLASTSSDRSLPSSASGAPSGGPPAPARVPAVPRVQRAAPPRPAPALPRPRVQVSVPRPLARGPPASVGRPSAAVGRPAVPRLFRAPGPGTFSFRRPLPPRGPAPLSFRSSPPAAQQGWLTCIGCGTRGEWVGGLNMFLAAAGLLAEGLDMRARRSRGEPVWCESCRKFLSDFALGQHAQMSAWVSASRTDPEIWNRVSEWGRAAVRREAGAFRIPGLAGVPEDEVVREWPVRGGANAGVSFPAFGGSSSFGAPHTSPLVQVQRPAAGTSDRLASLGAATLLDAMRRESVGGSSGGALQKLLDKASSVPATAEDRLVLMPQFLPWAKFDAASVRINRRGDEDSLSELRAHARSGRAMMLPEGRGAIAWVTMRVATRTIHPLPFSLTSCARHGVGPS